ncbi:MAG: HlyD family secretion protein [Clostridiales bacterium]|jgi:multidrug efflux pump subunit AcrA (membrane-fusion protein)|nr:HlyD family secretion protein [Clostridiales bacterium]
MDASKKIIVKISGIFLGVLLFLTFFSNTVATMNLPGVSLEFPKDGVIKQTAVAQTTVEYAESIPVYTGQEGILTMRVREGDAVRQGDPLFTVTADLKELRERSNAETNKLDRAMVNIRRDESEMVFLQNKLDTLVPDRQQVTDVDPPDIAAIDFEYAQIEADIKNAEADYAALYALYEAGAGPLSDAGEAARELESLRLALARKEEEKERLLDKYEGDLAKAIADDVNANDDKQRAFLEELQNTRRELENFRFDMELRHIDVREARQALEILNAQIATGGIENIYAQSGGIIRDIPAGTESGTAVGKAQLLARLRVVNEAGRQTYRMEAEFPERAGFVQAGMPARIKINGYRGSQPGTVERIINRGGKRISVITMNTELSLAGGESAEAAVEKLSRAYDRVLPNSAFHSDDYGLYVHYVERKQNGILGYTYAVMRQPVYILEQNDAEAAFGAYNDIDYPIIVNSDRPVEAGDRVKIVGGEDF